MTESTEWPVADATVKRAPVACARVPRTVRMGTLIVIVFPFLGSVAAPFFFWGWGFGWADFGLLLGMYLVTGLGITVGFHRLFTHRSFESFAANKVILVAAGTMALQGPLFRWVAFHRQHHQFSDTADDPHTPNHHGRGILGVLRGAWHSHIGWLFEPEPAGLAEYVKDLKKSKALRAADALWPLWVALGLAIPAVLGGLLKMSWIGVWTGLYWGGLVRIFLVHHVTFSVNSACHLWGRRPYQTQDESGNNAVFGLLALGEGWHNTHHAFPTSARHGLRWWQVDVSYYLIRTLAWVHLVWNVRLPSEEARRERLHPKGPVPRAHPRWRQLLDRICRRVRVHRSDLNRSATPRIEFDLEAAQFVAATPSEQ